MLPAHRRSPWDVSLYPTRAGAVLGGLVLMCFERDVQCCENLMLCAACRCDLTEMRSQGARVSSRVVARGGEVRRFMWQLRSPPMWCASLDLAYTQRWCVRRSFLCTFCTYTSSRSCRVLSFWDRITPIPVGPRDAQDEEEGRPLQCNKGGG